VTRGLLGHLHLRHNRPPTSITRPRQTLFVIYNCQSPSPSTSPPLCAKVSVIPRHLCPISTRDRYHRNRNPNNKFQPTDRPQHSLDLFPAMDLPPSKPKSAIPSHLNNGSSSHGTSTEARDKKERDNLFAAIQSSSTTRQVVDFDGPNGYFPKPDTSASVDGRHPRSAHRHALSEIDVEGYMEDNAARTPLATSRAHSPYTQHPTIDFDGLSWPSESPWAEASRPC
jgi:hypothetical protein